MTSEKFWESCEKKSDGCWQWTRARSGPGYGYLRFNGKIRSAHSVAVELSGRSVPVGKVIDHLCDNRSCINPDHLTIATQQQNILRGTSTSARNAKKKTCPQGHPYNDKNTYLNPRKNTFFRACRKCRGLKCATS